MADLGCCDNTSTLMHRAKRFTFVMIQQDPMMQKMEEDVNDHTLMLVPRVQNFISITTIQNNQEIKTTTNSSFDETSLISSEFSMLNIHVPRLNK
jgi:hypothetical protein